MNKKFPRSERELKDTIAMAEAGAELEAVFEKYGVDEAGRATVCSLYLSYLGQDLKPGPQRDYLATIVQTIVDPWGYEARSVNLNDD